MRSGAAVLAFSTVKMLLDYRPALHGRTGVGEYAHELAAGLAAPARPGDELVLFTSSWRDRPDPALAAGWPRTRVVDRRVPVRLLNLRLASPAVAAGSSGWPDPSTSSSRCIPC